MAPDKDESKSPEAAEVKPRREESKTPKANLRKFFKLVSRALSQEFRVTCSLPGWGTNCWKPDWFCKVASEALHSRGCVHVCNLAPSPSPQPPGSLPRAPPAHSAFCISLSWLAREQPRGRQRSRLPGRCLGPSSPPEGAQGTSRGLSQRSWLLPRKHSASESVSTGWCGTWAGVPGGNLLLVATAARLHPELASGSRIFNSETFLGNVRGLAKLAHKRMQPLLQGCYILDGKRKGTKSNLILLPKSLEGRRKPPRW